MATDWAATLKEQGDITDRMVEDVTFALGHPNLTLDQASRLYRAVEQGAQTFDQIVARMADEDIEEPFHEAAGTIADIWSNLSIATANRVRAMQGLEPIELPLDYDVS